MIDWPAQDAVAGLRFSLEAASTWTQRSFIWLALTAVLLAAWYRLRVLRPLWQCALVLLVAADLLFFARDYHPRLSRTDLAPRSRVVEFLRENNGLHRAYVAWPVTLLGPNRLLPYAIAEAGGYSSLVMQRHNDYVAAMQKQPQRFLDLMNVRCVVASPQSSQDQLLNSTKVFEEGSFYPGWQADIDGTPVPVLRANYLFRAVQIPSGRHTVSFTFRSTPVAVGALISLLTGIGIALGVAILRSRYKAP